MNKKNKHTIFGGIGLKYESKDNSNLEHQDYFTLHIFFIDCFTQLDRS